MFTTILDHGLLLLALMVGDPGSARASLELSPLVSDGAVLQRGVEVPIHGRAEPGLEVAVTFDGARYAARPDADGRWRVRLPAHEAGGPYELTAAAGRVLRPGRNMVAVRVEDTGGGGGIHGSADLLFVETGGGRRPLADTWKFRVGAVSIDADGRKNQLPTLLYNAEGLPAAPFRTDAW